MKVAPGVHRFETYPFNWYVIEDDDRLTLVDAGFPGHYNVLVAGLRSIGRELRDIKGVMLTHIHADHTGFAERLRRELGVPIFVHEDEVSAAQNLNQLPLSGLLLNAWRPFVLRRILGNAVLSGVAQSQSITEVVAYRHGEVLDVPRHPRIIHTPGHTDGSSMMYLKDRGVLFTGDAVVTVNLLSGSNTEPCVPPPRVNKDYQQAKSSVAKLDRLGSVILLPGHGSPWHGTTESLLAAVSNA